MNNIPKIIYLSHGGGPLPLLGDKDHTEMVNNLKHIAKQIKKPSAILVISAHWEANIPTLTSNPAPEMIYDYSGFPEESYNIKYPAPGEPDLAEKIYSLLKENSIEAKLDSKRGFDHGLYVPLKIMYPEADIPCIQLSLMNNLDPAAHINIGKSIADLDYEDLLIIGSGFSFHNMRAFYSKETPETKEKNDSFENWLIDTCSSSEINEVERTNRLIEWKKAPNSKYCHPREEHLLPLHVCYGVAGVACKEHYELKILNKKSSTYIW
ncbi:MAG: dioxygenase [Denitrovibrio sp.]|nr:MAG: dioxygenase [Denitrovibrio sp.]